MLSGAGRRLLLRQAGATDVVNGSPATNLQRSSNETVQLRNFSGPWERPGSDRNSTINDSNKELDVTALGLAFYVGDNCDSTPLMNGTSSGDDGSDSVETKVQARFSCGGAPQRCVRSHQSAIGAMT